MRARTSTNTRTRARFEARTKPSKKPRHGRIVYGRAELLGPKSEDRIVVEGLRGAVRQYTVTPDGHRRGARTFDASPETMVEAGLAFIAIAQSKRAGRGLSKETRQWYRMSGLALGASYLFAGATAARESVR